MKKNIRGKQTEQDPSHSIIMIENARKEKTQIDLWPSCFGGLFVHYFISRDFAPTNKGPICRHAPEPRHIAAFPLAPLPRPPRAARACCRDPWLPPTIQPGIGFGRFVTGNILHTACRLFIYDFFISEIQKIV